MHLPADGRATPGSILDGRYQVEEIIGEGGFAIVFRAKQLSTGQQVAVKVLRSADGVQRKRFEREMRLIGKLNHPHVVRLIDFGSIQARVAQELWSGAGDEETTETRHVVRKLPYIVMEYVDGCNLKKIIEVLRKSGRTVPLKEALYICMEACRGLSYAHELTDEDGSDFELVHRDVSPPNILISRRGQITVTDFGLAQATTQPENTDPGVAKGQLTDLSPAAPSRPPAGSAAPGPPPPGAVERVPGPTPVGLPARCPPHPRSRAHPQRAALGGDPDPDQVPALDHGHVVHMAHLHQPPDIGRALADDDRARAHDVADPHDETSW